MSINLDFATSLGAFWDKGGNLHWPNADASSFDVSRLKFRPECGQLLLQEDGTVAIGPIPRKRGRPRQYANNAERQAAYRRRRG